MSTNSCGCGCSGTPSMEPQIVEFGPYHAIGMRYVGKNANNEIPKMWEEQFIPRAGEIARPEGPSGAFGVCRCLPGVTDGSFEYIAAFQASEDASVPEGMVAVEVPKGLYAAFEVPSLAQIGQAWHAAPCWFEKSEKWEGRCGPGGCECDEYPCFEYYPPDFDGAGKLYIYMPVKEKK